LIFSGAVNKAGADNRPFAPDGLAIRSSRATTHGTARNRRGPTPLGEASKGTPQRRQVAEERRFPRPVFKLREDVYDSKIRAADEDPVRPFVRQAHGQVEGFFGITPADVNRAANAQSPSVEHIEALGLEEVLLRTVQVLDVGSGRGRSVEAQVLEGIDHPLGGGNIRDASCGPREVLPQLPLPVGSVEQAPSRASEGDDIHVGRGRLLGATRRLGGHRLEVTRLGLGVAHSGRVARDPLGKNAQRLLLDHRVIEGED
jgi:hypothetical protein